MKFSIITVCKNSEKTICRAIESVLNQNYGNYEYIIIDGKSVDNTLCIIKSYEHLFKGRLKFISEEDSGIYEAINKGIKFSTGDLIGILGSDDSYLFNTLNIVSGAYSGGVCDKIVYGLVNNIENGVHISTTGEHHNNLSKTTLRHQSCFIPKKMYDTYGLYNAEYKISADYELLLRFWRKGAAFKNLNIPLANFNQGGVGSNRFLAFPEDQKARLENKIITKMEYYKSLLKFRTSKPSRFFKSIFEFRFF